MTPEEQRIAQLEGQVAALLWRRRQTPEWETDLAICKQRTGAPEADVRLGWQGHITRFSDA